MKLLFDQNLPSRFVYSLASLFPESLHLKSVKLDSADDQIVWNYAKENNFTIISKDSDFHQMSFLYGAPPKVIWLRCGNCSVGELEAIVRLKFDVISMFLKSDDGALLMIDD